MTRPGGVKPLDQKTQQTRFLESEALHVKLQSAGVTIIGQARAIDVTPDDKTLKRGVE